MAQEFNTLLKATPLGKALSFASVAEFASMRRFIESESLQRINTLSKASDFSRVLSDHFERVQDSPMNFFLGKTGGARPELLRKVTSDFLTHLYQNRHDPRLQWVLDTRVR